MSSMGYDDLFTRFVGDEFDQAEGPAASRKLIVCTTPRTGGHTCCQQLMAMGLGFPTEYFQWQYALPLMRRWTSAPELGLDALAAKAKAYGDLVMRRRAKNGVFAAKVFRENLPFTRDALGRDDDSWLYLRLVRRDKIEQTISLLSLLYTGKPFDSDDQLRGIPTVGQIGPKSVQNTIQYIHEAEANWARLLEDVPAERQATLVFEDLVADPAGAVAAAVGRWFPGAEKAVAPVRARKYDSDREFKQQIRDHYAGEIARIWSIMPPTGF